MEDGKLKYFTESETETHIEQIMSEYEQLMTGKYSNFEDLLFKYALTNKNSIVQASTFLYGLLTSACNYADKNMNTKCKLLRDLVGLEGDNHVSKLDLSESNDLPSIGIVYNSLKIRAGFFNRLKLSKDEVAKLEAAQKGRKAKQSTVIEDTSLTSLPIIMRTIHQHYRENDFIIKQTLTDLIEDDQ